MWKNKYLSIAHGSRSHLYVGKSSSNPCMLWTTDKYLCIFLPINRIKQAETPYHPKLNYTTISSGATIKERGKEAQLKITVMADNSDEEEEMIKQALTASI